VFARIVAVTIGIGASVSGEGCACDDPTTPSGGPNGEIDCNECTPFAYECSGDKFVCAPNATTALEVGCLGASQVKNCYSSGDTEGVDEGGGGGGGGVGGADGADTTGGPSGCENWDPDSYVGFNRRTQKYEVDQTLVDDLNADPGLLTGCDSARSRVLSGGYYELYVVDPADLATQLGLQDADVIKSVNGYDLQWPSDYFQAFDALHEQSSFSLTFERGGTAYTSSYSIVP
jgi:hypothetical protein